MINLKISELKPNRNFDELVARVISVEPSRPIRTRQGRKTIVTEAVIGDETGTVIFTIFGYGEEKDIMSDMVIRIKDGWVKEWNGVLQVSLGRSGKLEKIEDDGSLPSLKELLSKWQDA